MRKNPNDSSDCELTDSQIIQMIIDHQGRAITVKEFEQDVMAQWNHRQNGSTAEDEDDEVSDNWDSVADESQARKPAPRMKATPAMAERIMDALCQNGQGDFLLLQDDEIREWWNSVTQHRDALARQQRQRERRKQVRERALNKLTAEERRVLGLDK